MMVHAGTNVGCKLVGEFLDQGEVSANSTYKTGHPMRHQMVADFVELWVADDATIEFTVLLKDQRTVDVRGSVLKLFPPTGADDGGPYGIAIRAGREELLVALFKILEVIGIYSGEMRLDRKSA